jgi:hypothetical protein
MLTSNDDVDLHIDGLLRSNVARVFNERDPQLRLRALEELWRAVLPCRARNRESRRRDASLDCGNPG